MKIRKSIWTTYATTGYAYDVANDQASAGGVHHRQVRKTKSGWQERICQSNGHHVAYGPVESISHEEGEAHWATVEQDQAKMERAHRILHPECYA
jgi:hypothetical protein